MKEKFAVQIVFNLIIQAFGIVLLFLKTSFLDKSIIGQLSLASSTADLFTMFLDLGIVGIHCQYSSKKDFEKYFGSFLVIKIFLILLNYTIPLIYLLLIEYDPEILRLIVMCLVSGVFNALTQIFITNLQVRMKILKNELTNFIIQSLNYGLQAYICINSKKFENPAVLILYVLIFVNIFRFIAYFIINLNESIKIKPNLILIKQYFIDSKALIIQSIFFVINNYIGSVILGNDSGYVLFAEFTVVNTYIISILLQIGMSVSMIFNSLFPKLFEEKKYDLISNYCNDFERYASIFYLFVILFVQIDSIYLFEIILPSYKTSIPYLRILILVPYLDGILRPYMGHLIQAKKQDLSAKISIINIFLSLILQIVFVSEKFLGFGIWGFIGVRIFIYLEYNFVYRYFSKRYFGIKTHNHHLKHILITTLSIIIGFLFQKYLLENIINKMIFIWNITNEILISIISLCLSCGVIMVVFLLLFIISKELQIKDLKFIKDLITPRNYINSLKEEL